MKKNVIISIVGMIIVIVLLAIYMPSDILLPELVRPDEYLNAKPYVEFVLFGNEITITCSEHSVILF